MQVVILAGGFGTRISEESYLKPKPMIEIGGMPILWHIMKNYSEHGFNEFIICCGYKQQYIKDFKKRYEGCNRHEKDFQPQSWIDYFLIGNVYIVGFGLDLAEMDLWWLLNCKKRNCQNQSKVFFFEPNMEDEGKYTKKMLAKAYGVEIITKNVQSAYKKYYKDTVKEVKNQLFSKGES